MGNGAAKQNGKVDKSSIEKVSRLFHSRSNSETFFYEIYKQLMRGSPAIQKVFDEQTNNMTGTETHIISLSNSVKKFIEEVINLKLKGKNEEANNLCFQTGRRHIKYSCERLEPGYWLVFVFGMTEVLENSEPKPTRDEVFAWQNFVRNIVEHMRAGYELNYSTNMLTTSYGEPVLPGTPAKKY